MIPHIQIQIKVKISWCYCVFPPGEGKPQHDSVIFTCLWTSHTLLYIYPTSDSFNCIMWWQHIPQRSRLIICSMTLKSTFDHRLYPRDQSRIAVDVHNYCTDIWYTCWHHYSVIWTGYNPSILSLGICLDLTYKTYN